MSMLDNDDEVYYKMFNRVEFEITAEKLDGASSIIRAVPMLESIELKMKLVLAVQNSETEDDDIEAIIDGSLGALYDQFLETVFSVLDILGKQKKLAEYLI